MPATVAWTTFEVTLSRDHLDLGQPRRCKFCPLALAVSEAIGSWRFVDVAWDGRIIVRAGNGCPHVEAIVEEPERVAELVRRIDAGQAASVLPTKFRIRCPFPPLEELS